MISHLPCKKCGSGLPIVKGSIAKCPYCGAKTLYMESLYSFKYHLSKILHLTSIKNDINIKKSEIERRKVLITSFFYKINSDFNEYRHLIITKLDNINIDPIKLHDLIRSAGNFEIIIENYLLYHLKDKTLRDKYQQLRDQAYLINKTSLGLYYSYLAKNSSYLENCSKYYYFVEKNFQNIVDFCNITYFEKNNSKIYEKKIVYEILTEFASILRGILDKNPKYYSKRLESLLIKLNKIKSTDFKKYTLYSQIESIYQLERKTSVLLERVKIDDPFSSNYSFEENFIYNTEENLEKLNHVRNWIKDISEKYQLFQRDLLKLHSGRLINYLDSYRTDFINYNNKNVEKFNKLLEDMIIKAFEVYNSEAVEVMNSMSDFLQNDSFNENIIEKFEIEYRDLINLDELLKKFIKEVFQKPLLRDFKSEYCNKLISLISGKHTEFDKYILNYVNRIFQNFEVIRNKKDLSLEEQKNQFKSELKPNLQKLLNLSFNLDEKVLSYPLFIDINVQNKTLKQNTPENINIIIENPNLTDIKDIKIYFFMPNSFQSKLKFTSIKRLRSNERRKIKTKITPKEPGTSLFMVMAEYQHTNKTFWMPSIKLEFKVEKAEEIVKYDYYQYPHLRLFQDEIEVNRIYKFIRDYI